MRRTVVLGLSLHFIACSGSDREFGKPTESGGTAGDATGGTGGGAGQQGGSSAQGGTHSAGAGGNVTAGSSGGGSAGAGGTAAECSEDADCNDKLVCNGQETCTNGVCTPGTPACANSDAVNCEVLCVEPQTAGGNVECITRGADKDGDQHRSSACAHSPGDDCDDSVATGAAVYPGNKEVCDGLDNDCNGKADVTDGLSVGGTNGPITPEATLQSNPSVIWAPEIERYGVAHFAGQYQTHLTTMTSAGEPDVVNAPVALGADPQIGWNGKSFGLLWHWGLPMTRPPKTDVGFAEVDANGNLLGAATTPTQQTLVAPKAAALLFSGKWALFWSDETSSSVSGYINSAVPISTNYGAAYTDHKRADGTKGLHLTGYGSAALFGKTVLFAWNEGLKIRRSLRDENLENPRDGNVTIPKGDSSASANVVVTATERGFALAWREDPDTNVADDEQLQYAELSTEGRFLCGPITLETPIKAYIPDSIASNSEHRVIVLRDRNARKIDFVQVSKACTWGVRHEVSDIASTGGAISAIASAGDKGFAIVWVGEGPNGKYQIMRRILGPHLCD